MFIKFLGKLNYSHIHDEFDKQMQELDDLFEIDSSLPNIKENEFDKQMQELDDLFEIDSSLPNIKENEFDKQTQKFKEMQEKTKQMKEELKQMQEKTKQMKEELKQIQEKNKQIKIEFQKCFNNHIMELSTKMTPLELDEYKSIIDKILSNIYNQIE
jgi:hypothetical protein